MSGGEAGTPPTSSDRWRPMDGAEGGRYVYLESSGDDLGMGKTFRYTTANAAVSLTAEYGVLTVEVSGDETWSGRFAMPQGETRLQPGSFLDIENQDPARPTFEWHGNGRSCVTVHSWVAIDGLTYVGDAVTAVDLRFEQQCNGKTPSLRGYIHWNPDEPSPSPSGPVQPPPADLWSAPAASVPAAGNYVYLQSDTGEGIGQGKTYSYTLANASITAYGNAAVIDIVVAGNEHWTGRFEARVGAMQLEPGYYSGLRQYPNRNPTKGSFNWSGEGRGCNSRGWFAADRVIYENGALRAFDVRFEQRCDEREPALRGQIRWDASDTTSLPGGPIDPPASLWKPAAGSTPPTGNYVLLQSDPSDEVGQGQSYSYTLANALIQLSGASAEVGVMLHGEQQWEGKFAVPRHFGQLSRGYYADLEAYGLYDNVRGGLVWRGEGRGCTMIAGWIVVDDVEYEQGELRAIDMRFEQRCQANTAALHGSIHWAPGDTTVPPGPVNPPPADLWRPPAGATPASGSYVYLSSDLGDPLGNGQTFTLTSDLRVTAVPGRVSLTVANSFGDFYPMWNLSKAVPGYYGDLLSYPSHNPVKGGLLWSGPVGNCANATGWFAVDGIAYSGDQITHLDLRFEQRCKAATGSIHGQVHYAP